MQVRAMSCCGVREINELSLYMSAPAAMRAFCAYINQSRKYPCPDTQPKTKDGDTTWPAGFHSRFRYVFFTQASSSKTKKGYGVSFSAFIRKHKLGEVVAASEGDHINPNSGNFLKMWTWTVDHEALANWAQRDKAASARVKAAKS